VKFEIQKQGREWCVVSEFGVCGVFHDEDDAKAYVDLQHRVRDKATSNRHSLPNSPGWFMGCRVPQCFKIHDLI